MENEKFVVLAGQEFSAPEENKLAAVKFPNDVTLGMPDPFGQGLTLNTSGLLASQTETKFPTVMSLSAPHQMYASALTLYGDGQEILKIDLKMSENYIHPSEEFLKDVVMDTEKGRTALFSIMSMIHDGITIAQLREQVNNLAEGVINGFNRKLLTHPGLLAVGSQSKRQDVEFAYHDSGEYVVTYRGQEVGRYNPERDGAIHDFVKKTVDGIVSNQTMTLSDDVHAAFQEARQEVINRTMTETRAKLSK